MTKARIPSVKLGCVGICDHCLGMLSDHETHEHTMPCPACSAAVLMVPVGRMAWGLEEIGRQLEKMQPVSIFHHKPIQPWPVLNGDAWHVDIRMPLSSPYARVAARWFPKEYGGIWESLGTADIPDGGYIGDPLAESLVIPKLLVSQAGIALLGRSIRQCRQQFAQKTGREWMEQMGGWLRAMADEDAAGLRQAIARAPRRLDPGERDLLRLIQHVREEGQGSGQVLRFPSGARRRTRSKGHFPR